MADYNGTDEDDIIDASELDEDIKNINSGAGNDTITNVKSTQEVRTSLGDDDISGNNFTYRISRGDGSQDITVNLKEGFSDDGFGTTDTLSGVYSVHTDTNHNTTIYGTSKKEEFWLNGGSNIVDGGGGDDQVVYYGKTENDLEIKYVGNEVHVIGSTTKDILTNVRYIKFFDDNKIVDVIFNTIPLRATKIDKVHSFEDDTYTPGYVYNNIEYKSDLVYFDFNDVILIDLNEDGTKDVVIPVNKGYATGLDNTTPFIALTASNGTLVFDEVANSKMPITSGARRTEKIKLINTQHDSFITVNTQQDSEANRNKVGDVPQAELQLIQPTNILITRDDIFPDLPESIIATFEEIPEGTVGQKYAVDAHSMGIGDINGDGLDDIFVGHGYANSASEGAYALIQQADGKFNIEQNDFYKTIVNWESSSSSSNTFVLLLDAALVDVNNDGFADLVAGYGHGGASSLIFMNSDGKFDSNNYIAIPESIYGSDNQMHMKTLKNDFDNDGDIDLAISYTRYEPYYAGTYLQLLINDGQGNFTDTTDTIGGDPFKDAYKSKGWVNTWQLIDFNNDGHQDIASFTSDQDALGRALTTSIPMIYFNDGSGRFSKDEVALESNEFGQFNIMGLPMVYSDFDNDKLIEFLVWDEERRDALGNRGGPSPEKNIVNVIRFEFANELGTGPNYSTDTAEQGAPGFNEQYYLNENTSAKEAVTAGTYTTGLEHYLAEGKDAGLKTFAPFTKVHGYSGNDNIVLREGNETALGYGGNDTIEGGAGNDTIDGGAGSDTAVFRDTYESYTLTYNDDGSLTVKHNPSSSEQTNEGIDTLTNIEKLKFSDLTTSAIQSKYSLSSKLDSSKNILEPFSETSKSGTLNFSSGNNIIVADGQAKTLRGLDGDDTYFISDLLPKNSTIEIIDTSGSNTIQIAANTKVVKTLWTKDATRLTFEDDKVITINGADNFTFNMGGNITNGTDGIDLTFAEFALSFGIDDILNLSGSDTGSVTDMYII